LSSFLSAEPINNRTPVLIGQLYRSADPQVIFKINIGRRTELPVVAGDWTPEKTA